MRNDIQKLRERAAGMNILSLAESRRFLMDLLDVMDRLDQENKELRAEIAQREQPVDAVGTFSGTR